MTRKTPIPLLRDLPVGKVVTRCRRCGDLVMMAEICEDDIEAATCQSRAEFECLTKPIAGAAE